MRRWAAVVVLVLATVLTAGAVVALGAKEPTTGPMGATSLPEGYRVFRLDDGRAGHVAVKRGDPFLVRWRGPRESAWSAPVVHRQPGLFWNYTDTRVAGSTLAIRITYSTRQPSDDWSWGKRRTVFLVCTPRTCEASRPQARVHDVGCRRGSCRLSPDEGWGAGAPQLSPEGSVVSFGSTEHGQVLWTTETGFHYLEPRGLPAGGELSPPLLSPDGSLRVVHGVRAGDRCRLTLATAVRASADYSVAFSYAVPSASGRCGTILETFDDDYVIVHTDQSQPSYLVRSAGTWRQTPMDPSGMVRYTKQPGRTAVGAATRTGYWHWREVVTASPDGTRLVAQTHFPGEPRWTDPVTVLTAPESFRCFEIAPTSEPDDEPFYVTLRCRELDAAGRLGRFVEVNALTEDGRRWTSLGVTEMPTRVGEDLFWSGSPSYHWTPEDGLMIVDLPVPAGARTFLVEDGTRILVEVTPTGSRCRLEVRVAASGASDWSEPIPTGMPFLPLREPCESPNGGYEGNVVRLSLSSLGPMWSQIGVTRRGTGEWHVEAPERFSPDGT